MKMSGEVIEITNLSINDFPNICRYCLGQENLKPIFSVLFEDVYISEIIQKSTALKISENDEMPQNICANCIGDVVKAHIFIEKCQQSYVLLKSIKDNADNVEEKIEIQLTDDSSGNNVVIKEENTDEEGERIEFRLASRKRKKLRVSRIRKELNYICKICSETFDTNEEYQLHKKALKHNVINVQKRACHICSKTFTNSKLRQHMLSHTKEKPYECRICSQRFSIRSNLKRHTMTHTGERPHVCEICGKGFIQATTLHKHKTVHTKREEIVPNCYPYICEVCGRGFKRLGRYNNHLRKHNIKSPTEYRMKKPVEDEAKEYACDICKRAYKTKTLLKTHQLTHGEKTFLCSDCGKGFITNAALQSHIRVHTGEKPYTCSICKKSFAHIGSFEAHSLIHSGQKPYQCKVCHKSFTQLTHLKYHLRTHSGERPYACTYCSKRFALKGNLTVHTRIHTGETPYICSVCGKGFYDSSSMKKHRRGHRDSTNMQVKEQSDEKRSNEIVLTDNCLILTDDLHS